ncbi:MAG: AraC family transcriptional regulator [Muribaculaceae bacterium]|nr:AraC family transcriptional regulator [Muribaculaceae bacterium]
MWRILFILILIFGNLGFAFDVSADVTEAEMELSPKLYKDLEALSNSELIKVGETLLSDRSTHAQAFAAFSIVINRHYQNSHSTPPDIAQVVEAMHHVGSLYLVSFFEYDMAYKYLSLARELAEENGVKYWLPYTYINLANLWEINKMAFPASTYNGMSYVTDAWTAAITDNNEELLPIIAFDMAILSYANYPDTVFSRQLTDFVSYPFKNTSSSVEIANDFVKGVRHWSKNNYNDAEKSILASLHKVETMIENNYTNATGNSDNRYSERQRLSILSALAELYIKTQHYDDALSMLRVYDSLTKSNPDFALDLYDQYMKYYKTLNVPDSVEKYHYLYLKGKEAVSNDNKLYEVGEKEFISKIERINEEVISLSGKNRIQRMQLTAAVIALLLLLALIGLALWAYIRLRNKSAQLYRKNVEMIDEQHQFHIREKQLQDELERMMAADTSMKSFQRNVITDAEAEILYSRIVKIMEEGGEVFQPDFTLERLSALAESKPRVVSQVINMKYGSNFSQFLNTYRLREACLRFQNTNEYGNYTVEAIAESVGYRSRTGFSSLFKKATGLSPSEYHRQAKRAHNA